MKQWALIIFGFLIFVAMFAYRGIYDVQPSSQGLAYKVNRFTGKAYVLHPSAEEEPVKPTKSDTPDNIEARFRSNKYKKRLCKMFSEGYSIEQVSTSHPEWSYYAIDAEHDKWISSIDDLFNQRYGVEDILDARPNWSRKGIQDEWNRWAIEHNQ